jgi:superfamily II DNA or RNA helicase
MVSPLNPVLAAIASAILGGTTDDAVTVGAITLRAHQREALRRVRTSVNTIGGALLADEPGLGKTYVALALAREFSQTIIVAPSALRPMWREAAAAAGVTASFTSMEILSRRDPFAGTVDGSGEGLVIVDEAHHVCNPATARYARLSRLAAYRRMLLLSATPVRNRRAELAALLALFMGPRAHAIGDAARGRCIIRHTGDPSLLPAVDGPHWHRVRSIPRLREMIVALPVPLPALDGREAAALFTITLARCWASSLAALDSALRRRLQRGAALSAILDDGRLPTRHELRAWVVGDDAVQLAFPMFAAHRTPDSARLSAVLRAHLKAVGRLRAKLQPRLQRDVRARAQLLIALRAAHPTAKIIAFTAHGATADALYHELHTSHGIAGAALLTSRGARTAGGPRPRADVIGALAASPGTVTARDDISLVITTDLLSEGVNLQGASVVVHLDIPWTPAGLEQRVGRAARMGSPHQRVHVHGFAPPAAAERLLALERHFARKHAERIEAARAPHDVVELRAAVRAWPSDQSGLPVAGAASTAASRTGFIAVVEARGESTVVCGTLRGPQGDRRWKISDAPRDLCDMARAVRIAAAEAGGGFESSARAALERWIRGRLAHETSGAAAPASRARRAILARIDAAVRRAPADARAKLAHRIAAVRALVDGSVSAGAECALGGLARADAADFSAWLTMCESRLSGGAARVTSAERGEPEIRALLLLRGPA